MFLTIRSAKCVSAHKMYCIKISVYYLGMYSRTFASNRFDLAVTIFLGGLDRLFLPQKWWLNLFNESSKRGHFYVVVTTFTM